MESNAFAVRGSLRPAAGTECSRVGSSTYERRTGLCATSLLAPVLLCARTAASPMPPALRIADGIGSLNIPRTIFSVMRSTLAALSRGLDGKTCCLTLASRSGVSWLGAESAEGPWLRPGSFSNRERRQALLRDGCERGRACNSDSSRRPSRGPGRMTNIMVVDRPIGERIRGTIFLPSPISWSATCGPDLQPIAPSAQGAASFL